MKCRLCLSENKLRKSHIIPEWAYAPVYNKKRQFMNDVASILRLHQKGYREQLLCQSCETRFSVFENYLKQVFEGIFLKQSHTFSIAKIESDIEGFPEVYALKGIDYDRCKLGILSILFRLSVSDGFPGYRLRPELAEALRLSLQKDIAPDELVFAVALSRLSPAIRPIITFGQYDELSFGDNMGLSWVMYGLVVDVAIQEPHIPSEWDSVILKKDGSLQIPTITMSSLSIVPETFLKMKRPQVRRFHRQETEPHRR